MKTRILPLRSLGIGTCATASLALALIVAGPPVARAQAPFSSGSNGSYGPLEVATSTTLPMPPDGVFHCTTVQIAAGATLRFTPNARNTPVQILATGDVVIAGIINLDAGLGTSLQGGAAGPGGFPGGNPGGAELAPGSGAGPGGGVPGDSTIVRHAVFGSRPAGSPDYVPRTYGNPLLIPLIGGSGGGGGPTTGGGGGGGAILIASTTSVRLEATAQITARGNYDGSGAVRGVGSGGAIRLLAPRVSAIVSPQGARPSLNVPGGDGGGSSHYSGRIRVDSLDRSQLGFSFSPITSATLGAYMSVQPNPLPRLNLVKAAGTDIAPDSGPAFVELPIGSAPEQPIEVEARDFKALVPVRIRIVPENGPATEHLLQLDNRETNPVKGTLTVPIPPNVRTAVEIWTGQPAGA